MSNSKYAVRNMRLIRAGASVDKIFFDEFWDDCQSNNRMTMNNSFAVKCNETVNVNQLKVKKTKKNNSLEYVNKLYQRAMIQLQIRQGKYNNNIEEKKQKELRICTWKPRLNKLTPQQKLKLEQRGCDIYARELNKQKAKWRLKQKSATLEGKCRRVFIIDYDVQKKIDNGSLIKSVQKKSSYH